MPDQRAQTTKIVGVDVDGITEPSLDGTRGSGLYRVPLKLNRRPSARWAELFRAAWDSPPHFTTMHRPGIASVNGDRVILDGTTIEEVRDVHVETVKLVLPLVDEKEAELEARDRARQEQVQQQSQDFRDRVRDVAGEIRFDD